MHGMGLSHADKKQTGILAIPVRYVNYSACNVQVYRKTGTPPKKNRNTNWHRVTSGIFCIAPRSWVPTGT